jgi:hypothetical protein
MFLRRIALPLALLAAAPVSAQTTPPPSISKSHEAAAARVVDKLWPLGTYRRMMDGTMSKMMDRMMQAMPEIMKKVEAATAHLPPPPPPEGQ